MSGRLHTPSYCIHRARNKAYVRLNGEMVYLGAPDSPESKEKYNRLIAEWLSSGRAYIAPAQRSGLSVNEVLLAYRRYAETYYVHPDGTYATELDRVNFAIAPVIELYGMTPAESFGPKALKAVRDRMVANGLSRLTINQRICCVKRVFGWAVEEELIPSTVFYGLKAVKGLRRGRTVAPDGKSVKPVSEQVTDAVMKFLVPTVKAMLKLHDLTGMRSGELVLLRVCDIEMNDEGKPWLYRPARHKTMNLGHERIVPIGPQAQTVLKPFLDRDVQSYVFSPAQAQAERDVAKRAKRRSRVQPSQVCRKKLRPKKQPGERYTAGSYRRALKYATQQAVKAGLLPEGTHWHPHQLRHNCATRIRKRHGLDAVRATLGHRSITQSADYAELDSELAITTAAEIG